MKATNALKGIAVAGALLVSLTACMTRDNPDNRVEPTTPTVSTAPTTPTSPTITTTPTTPGEEIAPATTQNPA